MTRRSAVAAATGLAVLLVLAACRAPGGAPSATSSGTLDGTWTLESGTSGGEALPLVAGRAITLVIDGDKVSGRACNLYGGPIDVNGSRITLGQLSMTEMACDEPMMSAEAAYHAALSKVDTAERRGDTLTLSGAQVSLRYRLEPPVADQPLIATTWTLESVISGDVASSTLGEAATLRLAPDGTLSGSTGCRSFTARYTLAGDRVSVSDLAADARLCTQELTPQDEHVLSVLSGPFTVSVDGASLTVTAEDGSGLQYVVSAPSQPSGGSTGPRPASPAPSASPTVADPDPIDRVFPSGSDLPLLPPVVMVDGIAGRVVSYCVPGSCADGVLTANEPFLADPTSLDVPGFATLVSVNVQGEAPSSEVSVPVGADGSLGPLPSGSWRYLTVFVRFPGGDAFYAWSLTR